jgi:hypothetical protein
LFLSIETTEGSITDFFVRVEFSEQGDGLLNPKESFGALMQKTLGRVARSLSENTLANKDFEVIIQIIPVNFVEQTLPDEVVVSGEGLETVDDFFESIQAKTYFEDRIEVQDLKFEPGYEPTIGQGYIGFHDYVVNECIDGEIDLDVVNYCSDVDNGLYDFLQTRCEAGDVTDPVITEACTYIVDGEVQTGLYQHIDSQCTALKEAEVDFSTLDPDLEQSCFIIESGTNRQDAIDMGETMLEGFGLGFQIFKLHSEQGSLKVHREQINQQLHHSL